MNRFIKCLEPRAVAAAIVLLVAMSGTAQAQEPPALLYGVEIEELEYRLANGDDLVAWDADAFVGSDIWKARWQSEAEYEIDARDFERLENQFVVQRLATDFFDVKAGVRFDTPEGENRSYAVVGLHGLAQQWFEIDTDLFLSEKGDVSARLDAEYELLITNRWILIPSAEINMAFSDDEAMGVGSGLSSTELGMRLSYDLVDRLISPYVGVSYERSFGKTADFKRNDGEDIDEIAAVFGLRMLF